MAKRDYTYDTKYESSPEQKRHRAQRNAARREYEKRNGPLPSTVDVDHKKPLKSGGSNAAANLRAEPRSTNRARKP